MENICKYNPTTHALDLSLNPLQVRLQPPDKTFSYRTELNSDFTEDFDDKFCRVLFKQIGNGICRHYSNEQEAHSMPPTQKINGSCLCGQIRYKAVAAPLFQAHCHCQDCRKTAVLHLQPWCLCLLEVLVGKVKPKPLATAPILALL